MAGIIKLAKMPKLLSSPDVPWNGTTPLVWLNVELVAAVLAGSGPALKIVIRHWLPSWGFSASTVDGSDKTPPISTMERQRKWLLARGVSGVLSEDETGLANDDERGGCLKLCGCRRGNEVKGELEMGVRE